ncbi:hypothetical protein LMG29542_06722 [Paraburkholderia humisilvae]|uniref:Uncharacterized protein n=1 Tax=Paraburkholderia humisilvae TaxID=627669 RepID=A0A6J5F2G4_9BURK|nr:hypothetical protein LMG29542_06722 [Paraburkholderia humisilvae]
MPHVMMPTFACGLGAIHLSMLLTRAKCRTASSLAARRASIARLGRSGQRLCKPSSGVVKSAHVDQSVRSASRSTLEPDSTVSEIALKPTHAPEKRDSAQP